MKLDEIRQSVDNFFDGDSAKTLMWLKTPNPMLGGISPNDMIKVGRIEKLHKFVMEAHEKNILDTQNNIE